KLVIAPARPVGDPTLEIVPLSVRLLHWFWLPQVTVTVTWELPVEVRAPVPLILVIAPLVLTWNTVSPLSPAVTLPSAGRDPVIPMPNVCA
ncbi:hypothetical protein L6232_23770, partial [Shewanella sp. C31]|nr:hypothetical protein [Shewanella electrica]